MNLKTREEQKEVAKQILNFFESEPEKRSVEKTRRTGVYAPKYKCEDGRMCAIGMMLIDPNLFREGLSVARHYEDLGEEKFYECFKSQYQKLPLSFLCGLQAIHDEDMFWYDYGLTQEGEDVKKKFFHCIENGLFADNNAESYLNGHI